MTCTVDRQGKSVDIPIRPAEAPEGTGRIGVQLAANAQVSTQKAESPGQAVQLAGKQFAKLTKMVVSGQASRLHKIPFAALTCAQSWEGDSVLYQQAVTQLQQ